MLDFQVLVLKKVMNSLFEYVFLTNSYARLVLFVYLYLTIHFYSSTEVLQYVTSQNVAKQSVDAIL